jgi:hypothetical protein
MREQEEPTPLPSPGGEAVVQAGPAAADVNSWPKPAVAEQREHFDRNAQRTWFIRGAALGASIGGPVTLALYLILVSDWPGAVLDAGDAVQAFVLGALFFGVAGGIGLTLYWSILHPVLLALFATDRFLRAYGTPEERGMIDGAGPSRR